VGGGGEQKSGKKFEEEFLRRHFGFEEKIEMRPAPLTRSWENTGGSQRKTEKMRRGVGVLGRRKARGEGEKRTELLLGGAAAAKGKGKRTPREETAHAGQATKLDPRRGGVSFNELSYCEELGRPHRADFLSAEDPTSGGEPIDRTVPFYRQETREYYKKGGGRGNKTSTKDCLQHLAKGAHSG